MKTLITLSMVTGSYFYIYFKQLGSVKVGGFFQGW